MANDTAEDGQQQYGGLEGPDSMYVKLISSDEHEFIVKREHAMLSVTIRAMLSGPGQYAENEVNVIRLNGISSHVLKQVCVFFAYKTFYTKNTEVSHEFPIPVESSVDLILASEFLEI